MSEPAQNFENHAKLVTGFHKVLFLILLTCLIWFIYRAITDFSPDRLFLIILTLALFMTTFFARRFPMGVQDRVIRMEERVRMQEILPEDLRPRIGEFTTDQLIGLRFASDEELPDLARRVLNEGISDRKPIKAAVKNWRADHQRI